MELGLRGRTAIVCGGSAGIGLGCAEALTDAGANVVLFARGREVLEREATRLGAVPVAGDVRNPDDLARLVDTTVERFGGVDVLVNSTGIFRPVPFEEQTEEHFEEALGSILRPTYWVSQAAAAAMRDQGEGGAIVNVGSMWAVDAIATTPTSAYSAAQAGRHALTKNLALELAPEGLRVNTVALAFVETPAYERFLSHDEAQGVLDAVSGFHPLGRRGQPGDVVEAILFLAGGDASWITGTTLPIDGGVLAGRSPAVHAEVGAGAA
jgi:NAD(P)-dependent dehydrogenase (short-subunit alcohol dehydrogenase family)